MTQPEKRPPKNERILTVRIPAALVQELDRCVEQLRGRTPWAQMTRSDAVRWILIGALKREEVLRHRSNVAFPMRPGGEPPPDHMRLD